jgi:plasmid stabilization system protein ParE
MTVRLRPLAAAEAREARAWYEGREQGLGEDFERELRAVLVTIEATPAAFAFIDGSLDIRRALLGRFPYGVFYLVQRDAVVILAVAHLRRAPRYWQDRK